MIQDKLIEGAVYWVKHYKDWLTIPCVYIAGDWIIGDDTLDSKHVTDWLLIPTPEEMMKERRDWPEDFSLENGNYDNHCKICGKEFIGHKRRLLCKLCRTAQIVVDAKGEER